MKKFILIIFLVCLFLILIAWKVEAGEYESFQQHDDSIGSVSGKTWWAQTFLTFSKHQITGIKFWAYKGPNVLSDNFKVFLSPTGEGGFPIYKSDLVLASSTLDGQAIISDITLDGAQYQAIFDSAIELEENITYAIIWGKQTNLLSYLDLKGLQEADYPDGESFYSNDEGKSWTLNENHDADLYFINMGEEPCPATSSEDMCICTTTLNYISNTSTGAGFWLDNSISLGDFLIASFLLGILVLFIVKTIFDLEIPRKINYKKI